jgi:hypothetical protein
MRILLILWAALALHLPLRAQSSLLETLGHSAGQGVYLTYLSVGMLADAYSGGVYEDSMAMKIMGEMVSVSEGARKQFGGLLESGELGESDAAFIRALTGAYNSLHSEAYAYLRYMETGEPGYLDEYNSHREAAWSQIAALLGLD